MKQTVKAGITCFALVLGVGFILGSIRVPFLCRVYGILGDVHDVVNFR